MKEKKYKFVYISICKINGKCYIGSHCTNNINDKYFGSGQAIKNAIKKYKNENFLRIILKYYNTVEEARLSEGKYIRLFDTLQPNGYNVHKEGGTVYGYSIGMLGKTHTEETKEKIRKLFKDKPLSHIHKKHLSDSLKGHIISNETREKISKTLIKNESSSWKKPRTPEQREQMSKLHKGKKLSKEQIEIIRNTHLGKKLSEEHKEKISKANIGRTLSEETKKKIGEANKISLKGKKYGPRSEEVKKKISDKNTGKKRTNEQRKRISESHKGQIPWNKGKHKDDKNE
jgi:group I intron endonuclease